MRRWRQLRRMEEAHQLDEDRLIWPARRATQVQVARRNVMQVWVRLLTEDLR